MPKRKKARKPSLRGRDFLSMLDFTGSEIWDVLRTAKRVKAHPERYRTRLRSKHLAMIFEKPSLRTRVSFEVGMRELGGDALYLAPSDINLGKRESVYDVAKNLERMVHGIMIRTFDHDICVDLAKFASIPVVNGLTDLEHPCQVLSDLFTIWETKRDVRSVKICFVGDGNNVAHSLLLGAARLGFRLMVASPEAYQPKASVVRSALEEGGRSGVALEVTEDIERAVRDADFVYTDVWASMGQEGEAEQRRNAFRPYQVNSALFSLAKPDACFMHCLPAHRGEEVTDDVIDSPNSIVFRQAENRLHVQKAVLTVVMR